jgi:hypothetical protein
MSDDWTKAEDEAIKIISKFMSQTAHKRWDKATPAERKAVGRKLAQARKAKRKKAR